MEKSGTENVATLSGAQRRRLRGLAHSLKPLVAVGKSGLVPGTLRELENALDHHELIKVRLQTERADRRLWAREIATATRAELVSEVGSIAIFYRAARDPEKKKIGI